MYTGAADPCLSSSCSLYLIPIRQGGDCMAYGAVDITYSRPRPYRSSSEQLTEQLTQRGKISFIFRNI